MSTSQTVSRESRLSTGARLYGALILLAGLGMSWFFGLYPLQQAEAGVLHIKYDVRIFVAGPMIVACGLMLLLGGARVGRAFSGPPRTREQHLLVWPMVVVALAAGGCAYWWFTDRLHTLGYVSAY